MGEADRHQLLGERLRVRDHLRLVGDELGEQGFGERDRLGRDDVHERATLHAGEHRRVDGLRVLLPADDGPAARAAQGLVRRRRHELRVRHGVGVNLRRHQPGDVGHVDHQHRADFFGNRGELGEVQRAGVGARTGDDQLRFVLARLRRELVEVDSVIALRHAVAGDLEILAAEVQLHAVREVPAVGEIQTENGVARLQHCEEHGHVGLGARVRLHVDVVAAEDLLRPAQGQPLRDIDELAAAVIPLAGVAFGVLVREHRPLRGHHGLAGVVFRRDHLETVALPVPLAFDGEVQFGVGLLQNVHTTVAPVGRVRCVLLFYRSGPRN